jgi:hypothetical protein
MTIESLKEDFKKDRSRALESLVGLLYQQTSSVIPKDEYLASLEWDSSGGLNGVQSLYKQFYSELYQINGSSITSPPLSSYTREGWEERYRLALTPEGDGSGGLYPSGTNSSLINTESVWLNWNGYSSSFIGGLIDHSSLTHSTLGAYVTYTQTGDPDTPGTWQTIFTKSSTRYNNLLSSFNDYISFLNTYKTKWNSLVNKTDNVFNILGTSLINIDNALDTLISDLQSLMDSVTTQYNNATSPVTVSGWTTEIPSSFFNYRDSLDNLKNALNNRRSSVESKISSLPITSYPSLTLKECRLFLVTARLARLNGSYSNRLGTEVSIDSSKTSVKEFNATLSSIETDKNKWLPTPQIISSYYEEVRNSEQQLIRTENTLLFDSPGHISQINIFRKSITSNSEFSNTEWDNSTLYTSFTDRDEDTGYIRKDWKETIGIGARGVFYLYRIQLIDDGSVLPSSMRSELIPSPGVTKSQQSPILGTEVSFTKIKDILLPSQGWTTLLQGPSKQLKTLKGNYVYMAGRGIRMIIGMTENDLLVYPSLADEAGSGVGGKGSVFNLKAVYGLINSYAI